MGTNRGRSTERWIELLLTQYEAQGIARIRKVDPPTRTVQIGQGRAKTINLANPFLDFFGTWTAREGRAVTFEVKHTEDDSLKICRSGGITETQWAALRAWRQAGCATFVIWEHRQELRLLTAETIEAVLLETGRKSVPWSHAIRLIGGGTDFLATAQHLT
jgi:penicillin-binding protein-related factor A (putative recombinase)